MSDELNSAAKDLVASARRSGRTLDPGRRARLRYGVVAGVTTSSMAAAASASMGKLVLVGALSAALGSGATLLVVRSTAPKVSTPSPPPPAERKPAQPVVLAAKPPVVEPPAPIAKPSVERPVVEARRPVALPAVVQPPPAPAPPPEVEPRTPEVPQSKTEVRPSPGVDAPSPARAPRPTASELAEELALLGRVLAATQAQRWSDAEALLAEHERRFSPPALRSEARAMQVQVWCGTGHVEEARRLARELERTDPLNPAVQRLRTTCAW
ncbi:MAG: hypothetical protein ACOZQL_03525 [Myxococcota bacterium]